MHPSDVLFMNDGLYVFRERCFVRVKTKACAESRTIIQFRFIPTDGREIDTLLQAGLNFFNNFYSETDVRARRIIGRNFM